MNTKNYISSLYSLVNVKFAKANNGLIKKAVKIKDIDKLNNKNRMS